MPILRVMSIYFNTLDLKQRYTFIAGIIAAFLFVVILFLYGYYSRISRLEQQLIFVNRQREETRLIIEKYEYVLQQQAHVDSILENDKNFKIKEYFMSVIRSLHLEKLLQGDTDIFSADLFAGHIEIGLSAKLVGIDMKQLVDLLYKVEENNRMYVKELKISKSEKNFKIDVSVVIATFEMSMNI